MKLKLKVSRAGAGFCQNVGDEIEVENAEGLRMIEAGQAVEILSVKKEFATTKTKSEKAAK